MKPLLILALTVSLAHAQGPLTPPGAPAPIMKSLAQIEARTAISGNNGLTPAAGPYFTISSSGSYYLTGNITVLSGDAIRINASGVTLDLNGFSILSASTDPDGSGTAILASTANSIHFYNGSISSTNTTGGFGGGIYTSYFSNSAIVHDITLTRVVGNGIYLGQDSTVERCTSSIKRETAITAITATNCIGRSSGGTGIFATTATNCTGITAGGGNFGIVCIGTASYCRGTNLSGSPSSNAIEAAIAVACTSGGGIITGNKQLGTP